MNKKLFLGMFAAAGMLLATSCSNDELDMAQSGNEAQVTFSLGLEGGITTRAISDGTGAKTLICAVYDANETLLDKVVINDTPVDANGQYVNDKAFQGGLTDNVRITLAKGQTYTIAFWAQNEACKAYTTTDLKNVLINYNGLNNDETRDAFFAAETFTVSRNAEIDVTLKRPFAQINVGVKDADWNAAVASGIEIEKSKVVIKNAATSINLLNGNVDGEVAVEYGFGTIPQQFEDPESLSVDTDGDGVKESFKYLSMSYILVNDENGGASKATLETDGLQFVFAPEEGKGNNIVFDEGLNNVPVQRNWRTNILGQILTGNITFNITIDPIYDGDYNYPDYTTIADGVSYNAETKTYTLSSYEGLEWYSKQSNVSSVSELHSTVANSTDKNGKVSVFSGQTVILATSVDMTDKTWTPIGKNNIIAGTFDGGNNTISNLTITGTDKSVGLFANSGRGMTIKNIKMTNVNLTGSDYVGAIVGYGLCARIENCHVDGGTITANVLDKDGGAKAGGIVGYLTAQQNAHAKDCSVKNMTITAYRDVAAVIGMAQNAGCVVENVSADNVTVIANRLQEYKEETAVNAGTIIGRNSNNPEPVNATENNVEVIILEFDENGVLELPSSAAALNCVASAVTSGNDFAGKTVKLTGNINMADAKTNGNSNAPIGSSSNDTAFRGTFDGDGHTISNLYQSGWDLAYDWDNYGSVGLFAQLDDATVKNLTLEGFEAQIEGGDIAFVAGSATGDCTFENIEIKNGKIGTYNNGIGSIIGWSGAGNYTFKNIKIGSDVVLGGLWGSFDSSVGGIVGQAEAGASYTFENVEINCRLDVYNDCTASYDYYLYRMCGMIIGRCKETTTIDGKNYPDLSKYEITCTNVTVNYGEWMNYHYCEPTPGHNNGRGMRVEPGYAYDGLPDDFDHTQCVDNHYNCIPFDGLFGGNQLGVDPIKAYEGVTVNYPAEYTCSLCDKQHNSTSNE